MTIDEMKEEVVEGCNKLLFRAGLLRLSAEQKAIITAERNLFLNNTQALQMLYDLLPESIKEEE